nr:Retrovirus-related Pol polyprotein from transposon TNT 1-94 [Ipomoea batatas]
MSLERSENFIVRLNGKNYSAWAFQFELFVKGKELWSHINGSDSAPDKEKEKEKYAKWEVKDAQIMSWILGSVEPSILINLKPYKTSRGMWDYLKKVYIQNNSARRFQLELELGQLSQGSMSIQEFYSSFETLWVEYTDIVYANVPPEGLSAVQSVHETSKRDQFLMKLRGEFETIRSNLMNRQLVPSMDICVGELLREEQRLTTLAVLEQKAQNSAPIPVAYAAQTRPNRGRDMTNVQCYSCKNFGHFATNCTKKFCNYCKKAGHIIKECSIRPPKKHETAYNVSVGSSTASNAGQSTITPEMVQQMIVSALSAFGLSGNNNSDSKPWYFDSGASHHMTNTALPLKNVQKYSGDLHIHTADGNSLPITTVGSSVPGKRSRRGPKFLGPILVSDRIMSLERSENFIVRLNGKNYSAWAFQFELFVKGKELWSHINGSDSAPDKEKEKEKYAKWEVKDAQIMSWILGSVEPSILINLKPYKTSRGMWDYLKKVYIQNNSARRFQLELELGQLSQGSMSIQEFYSSFETLWVEYTDIVYANVPPEGLSAVQSVHETSKRDQFLMKLRGEFETIRSNLMNRQLVPSMDICVGELLREEQRLTTLAVLEQKAQNSAPIPVAYAVQTRPNRGRDMTNVQCYSCKNFGHFATNCTKKFCNYCKKAGHIIKECSIRPPKKHETAYNVSVGPSTASNAGQSTITPEMVQQMIVSALSAFGLSGNNNSDSKPWYFDSGASHHMTNTALPLKNVQKYSGDLQIHTADGNSLPITAVGDISASLNNVFVSPKLSTNLISVGQLVDSNCTVQFSKSGCFVQDQVSGKMIAKGPKVGRLFPLFLSPPLVSNYVACNAVQSLTSAPSHQPATTDSVLPSSIDPPPLRRSSRPHKPVESSAVQQIAVVLCRQQ